MSIRQVRELLDNISTPRPELLAVLCRDRRVTVRRLAYRLLRKGGDMASNEEIFRDGEVKFLAGTDEAGRGALAGPLAAAAVMFAPGTVIEGVRDSKELLPGQREELYERILSEAVSISVSFVDPGLVDRWGVQLANLKALGDAVDGLDSNCQRVICDHFSLVGCSVPVFGIPQADATFQSVAAASIIARWSVTASCGLSTPASRCITSCKTRGTAPRSTCRPW